MSITRTQMEEQLVRDIKPLFKERELQGGLTVTELQNYLDNSALPSYQLSVLLYDANLKPDDTITYEQLHDRIMQLDYDTLPQLSISKKLSNKTVEAVAPYRINKINIELGYMDESEFKVNEYIETNDCKPPPFMMPLVTITQIAVFSYYSVLLNTDGKAFNDVTTLAGFELKSPLPYSPYRRNEAWRFITYMLVHSGYLHLIINCIIQLFLGTLLETVYKFWTVSIVYLMGVLAGSLIHSVFDPKAYLVGASGGSYALIGFYLATVIIDWEILQKHWLETPAKFMRSGIFRFLIVIIFGGIDCGLAVFNRFFLQGYERIGYIPHLAGFLAGLYCGIPLVWITVQSKKHIKVTCITFVLYFILVLAGIIFNFSCSSRNICYSVDYTRP